jgi:hypothetical protein
MSSLHGATIAGDEGAGSSVRASTCDDPHPTSKSKADPIHATERMSWASISPGLSDQCQRNDR